jgi:hypothetical protein
MRSILRGASCAAAVCVLTGTLHAASGVLVVEKTTSGASSQTNQIQIEPKRMRAESSGAAGRKQIVVFDATKQILTLIDPTKKTYTEMTKEDMDRLGGQVSAAMEQMKKQMATLPPEQRAQVEAMMKGRGVGAAAPPKPQYKKVGTDVVGKWTCDKYEGYEGGKKTSEVCTVDPKVLGFSASDFEISRQLVAFFRKLVPQIADQTFTIGTPEEQGFSGVPVRRVFAIGGQPATTEILEISRRSFADSIFAVPEGFQKQEFLGAGRGR